MKKELSVVVPAFNEEQRIESTVSSIDRFLSQKGYSYEILVVDDGSTDGTGAKLDAMAQSTRSLRVLRFASNRGKGEAVKAGVREARMAYCLFMDADNATTIQEWEKFEPQFERGARAVVASRHLPGSRIVHPQPPLRRVLGGVYRGLCRAWFGLSASDFNCGFKAYETALAKKTFAQVCCADWAFDTEIFCLLKREGVVPAEVPVSWEHCAKPSNLAPVRAGLKTFSSLWRLKKIYR